LDAPCGNGVEGFVGQPMVSQALETLVLNFPSAASPCVNELHDGCEFYLDVCYVCEGRGFAACS